MKSTDLQEGANEKSIEKRGGLFIEKSEAPFGVLLTDRELHPALPGARPRVKTRTWEEGTKPHKNAHLWTRAMADSTGNVQGSIAKDKILTGKELQILLMYLCWLLIASLRAEKYNLEACLPPA